MSHSKPLASRGPGARRPHETKPRALALFVAALVAAGCLYLVSRPDPAGAVKSSATVARYKRLTNADLERIIAATEWPVESRFTGKAVGIVRASGWLPEAAAVLLFARLMLNNGLRGHERRGTHWYNRALHFGLRLKGRRPDKRHRPVRSVTHLGPVQWHSRVPIGQQKGLRTGQRAALRTLEKMALAALRKRRR